MISANGLKAILFDLDGTLRFNRPAGKDVFAGRVVELGFPLTEEDRLRAARWEHYYWAQSPELMSDIQAYGQENGSFWASYSRRQLVALGCSLTDAQAWADDFVRYMDANYKPDDWVEPETPSILESLREGNYKLAVVSNRTNPFGSYLDELGLGRYFDFSLAAGEINSWKPDKGIFHHALELAGVSPGETIYVGDNYFADVVGARAAGIKPVLIDPDGVFPDPGCPVIHSLKEIPDILGRILK